MIGTVITILTIGYFVNRCIADRTQTEDCKI